MVLDFIELAHGPLQIGFARPFAAQAVASVQVMIPEVGILLYPVLPIGGFFCPAPAFQLAAIDLAHDGVKLAEAVGQHPRENRQGVVERQGVGHAVH